MVLRIYPLAIEVANQIAAGEVIERPASVVKELLENALDAGASAIQVEIHFGGFNRIAVMDNGQGIVAEDLPLAIAAHATSKITELNDIYSITSMGFRGEALASIASVSQLLLVSKPISQEHAMQLCYHDGQIRIVPCARRHGTTVEVKDLFYNAPVRKKFLKTEQYEYQAIENIVKRFALSVPNIAITLLHNEKQMFHLPAVRCEKTKLERIRKILGKVFVEQSLYLSTERLGFGLEGWVTNADYQRSQNDKQWIYVNQRMVKDKLIHHAIKQAYAELLHPDRHAGCLLYLTVPTHEVDINVHPTKYEVRFQEPRLIHDLITSQITKALKIEQSYTTAHSSYPKTTHLELREQASPAYYPSLINGGENDTLWTIINTHFVLIFLYNQPFLINIKQVHAQHLLSQLQQQTLPLESRFLTMPIACDILKSDFAIMDERRHLLASMGIESDWMGAEKLLIRSIPKLLPHLDIKLFITLMHKNKFSESATLLQLLVDCQPFDLYQLDSATQKELVHFLQQLDIATIGTSSWGTHLTVERCQAVLS